MFPIHFSVLLFALLSTHHVLAQGDVGSGFSCTQNNVSLEYNCAIRLELSGISIINESGISVNCSNCYITSDLSFASGSVDYPPDSNFSGLPFDFQQDWAAAVVEDFTAHFELDFMMTASTNGQLVEAGEGLIPGFRDDGISFFTGLWHLFGVEWEFNPTIHAAVNTSNPVNFTYGCEFVIPPYSAVFIGFNDTAAQSIGFNQSKLTPLNYTSTEANEDFFFELSFRPEFKVALDVIIEIASGTVFADVPKLDVSVNQVYNVTHDCQPAPTGTTADLIFSDLTYVVPILGYDIGFEIDLFGIDVASETFSIGNNETLQTSCLIYSAQAQKLVPVPAKKSQGRRRLLASSRAVIAVYGIVVILTYCFV